MTEQEYEIEERFCIVNEKHLPLPDNKPEKERKA